MSWWFLTILIPHVFCRKKKSETEYQCSFLLDSGHKCGYFSSTWIYYNEDKEESLLGTFSVCVATGLWRVSTTWQGKDILRLVELSQMPVLPLAYPVTVVSIASASCLSRNWKECSRWFKLASYPEDNLIRGVPAKHSLQRIYPRTPNIQRFWNYLHLTWMIQTFLKLKYTRYAPILPTP